MAPAALIGALAALGCALWLGRGDGAFSRESVILAGIAVAAFLGALVALVKALNEESVTSIVFWIMTRDRSVLREAWRVAAQTTRDVLESGQSAAFLTIGDPLVYSTFGYLMRTLGECAPHLAVEVIPGITSFQAAAARTRTVLCENGETLRIIPGINSRESLEDSLQQSDTAVILKAYRNLPAIAEALGATNRLESCVLASHEPFKKYTTANKAHCEFYPVFADDLGRRCFCRF